MGRTAGRSAEDTRRQILDAAGSLVRSAGTSVTLSEIAETAGVSKGGLLYHFPNKDLLLQALSRFHQDAFREAVLAAVEPDDHAPGRLTRAYVRANFSTRETARDDAALAAQLGTHPALQEMARADGARWRTELADDGLDDATTRLVVAAADGISAGLLWGEVVTDAERDLFRDELLALTRS